jgi:hypothetical protein
MKFRSCITLFSLATDDPDTPFHLARPLVRQSTALNISTLSKLLFITVSLAGALTLPEFAIKAPALKPRATASWIDCASLVFPLSSRREHGCKINP